MILPRSEIMSLIGARAAPLRDQSSHQTLINTDHNLITSRDSIKDTFIIFLKKIRYNHLH